MNNPYVEGITAALELKACYSKAKARIAELEEMLRPFAFREEIEEEIPLDAHGHYELFVEAEDIRHARKVLDND